MTDIVHRDRLIRGGKYFALLTIAGLGAIFFVTGGDAVGALRHVSPGFIILACVTAVLDLIIGAYRYQIFLTRIKPGSPFSLPIRADLANRFVGAVTPSQTGGGPGQIFILFKGGIPIPDALSFLAINFLSTMVFFLISGGFTAYMFRGDFASGTVVLLVRYGFVAFASMGLFVFVALLRPDLIERSCRALVTRLGAGRTGLAGALHRAATLVVDNIGQYRSACTRFIREAPLLLVWSFVITVVLYVNKFTVAYFVLRGLGASAPYLQVLAIQALLQFVLYIAPTPGASGIAEVTTAALMARFMDPALLGVFTTVFRFFLQYLPAAVGCVVLIAALKPKDEPRLVLEPAAEAEGSVLP
jgi:uncharacterized protein (TIRG00374 family)